MDLELLELDYQRRGLRREVRLDEDSGAPRVRGYAAVFNQEKELWPGYHEVIRPGAFAKTLGESAEKLALWDHDTAQSLASTAGQPPLRLWEDEHGLGYDFEAPLDLASGRDLVARLRRRLVPGSSFGFRALEAPEIAKNTDSGVVILREIREAELFEVSPVSFPAYAGTDVKLRLLTGLRLRALTQPELRSIIEAAPPGLGAPARPTPRRDGLEEALRA